MYQSPRRDSFRTNILKHVLSGRTQPKHAPPSTQCQFLGITQTLEPGLAFPCWHDLWVEIAPTTGKYTLFAVYGENRIRKGFWQSWGFSPALTEARHRAIDMGLVAYSPLLSDTQLDKLYAQCPNPTPAQAELIELEESTLDRAVLRNTWIRLLQGDPAARPRALRRLSQTPLTLVQRWVDLANALDLAQLSAPQSDKELLSLCTS